MLSEILERIKLFEGFVSYNSYERSLLHAYVACLNLEDLCAAIVSTITSNSYIRRALRNRLVRALEAQADVDLTPLVQLIEQTTGLAYREKSVRKVTDALHIAVFGYLPLPGKQMLLDQWIDRSTSGAMARWLKATKQYPELFDPGVALDYWRRTGDFRAAKSLAYQASPEFLRPIVPEMIEKCGEGWIIAKAVIRSGWDDDASWVTIYDEFPATYLYVCAVMGREVTDDQALELVLRCRGFEVYGDRGLAIWAVGKLGKIAVLDKLSDEVDTLRRRDMMEMYEELKITPLD